MCILFVDGHSIIINDIQAYNLYMNDNETGLFMHFIIKQGLF